MTARWKSGALAARIAFVCGCAIALSAGAAPTPAQIAEICNDAEDQAHCGRLIEQAQMKRLPGLAVRDGDDLRITLFPAGAVTFRDTVALSGGKSFAVWDYLDRINAVVLFTTDGDQSGFLLLQRANGRQYRLPSEPTLSPDRQYLATADFCATACEGELAVWRVTPDAVVKSLVWKPDTPWSDARAAWKDADTLRIEYTIDGETAPRTLERRLDAAGWTKR